ncbi:efflux RND transporter periplasmic adaptor subunit [Sodalis sp. RH22]|uniref:efflux RND transporter periplasmic adaptor subunit n=1 Tax=unclassified Sodalis (in: enterobacteria) TaxID=2636512 RepID=UPI0039B425AC
MSTPKYGARLAPLLLLPALAALMAAGCKPAAPAQQTQQAIPVAVTTVMFQPVRQWDDFTGRLEAIQSVDVRPRVGGFIDAIAFDDGARVHKGQVLYQIDPRPYQAEVDRLEAGLQQAVANAALARTNRERSRRLIVVNAISSSELDAQEANAKVTVANVAAAQAALATARLNLSFTQVSAPIDGRISKALITRGNLVTTDSLLTTIVSDSPIYAAFNVDEQAYLKYAAAQRGKDNAVFIGLMGENGFPHRARLRFLDNVVDPRSGTLAARAVLDNADGSLTPGLFSRVRLVSSEVQRVALLPEQALGTDLGKRYVLVLDKDRRVQYRAITLGQAVGEWRIVKSGLNEGEQVVVDGLQKVRPGDVVAPHAAATDTSPAALAALLPHD